MNFKSKKLPYIILGLSIFVFILVFYINIRPLVVYDGDDWTYVSSSRQFVPIVNDWNPARVLPETFMSLCGNTAAFFVYPLTGDYVGSFTIVFAVVLAIFISLYICLFCKVLSKVFSLKTSYAISLSILFFLFHFLLFASGDQNNYYLFLTGNATCYFYYLIPNLLNMIIVFYLMMHEDYDYSLKIDKPLKFGIFLAIIYAAIFSNLYCSIILAVFVGSKILVNFFKELKNKFKIFKFIKKYALLFGIIIVWIISALYELTGGRAKFSNPGPFWPGLKESIKNVIYCVNKIPKGIMWLFIIIDVVFIIKFIIDIKKKKNRKYIATFSQMLICIVVSFIYLMLLSARVSSYYAIIPSYVFSFWGYFLIFEFMCLAYLVKTMPKVVIILPLLVTYYIFNLNCSMNTLYNDNSKVYKEISNDIISQIKEAEKKGESKIYIHVPDYGVSGNWPLASFLGPRMAITLYKHNITNKILLIEVVPDPKYNEKYHITAGRYGL